MSLLEVKDLTVRVDDREILHGLSLTVNEGEVVCLLGRNGAGRTTRLVLWSCARWSLGS